MKRVRRQGQSGSTAVEFALVLVVFLMFLLGITDFSRMLFTWNAATEATRAGARFAAVCDDTFHQADVLAKMQAMLPQITSITVDWFPTGSSVPGSCTSANCEAVRVRINGLNYQWVSPIAGLASLGAIPMPTFETYLPREIMRQDLAHSNAICS